MIEKEVNKFKLIKNGNMFLTTMKVVTIPVNLEGVMNDGLALATKRLYQDIYLEYKTVCDKGYLNRGTPYLYRYSGFRWFLLFPTKRQQDQLSNIDDIRDGLQWIIENQKNLFMSQIALPALGCGLGGLNWKDVKPIIIEGLSQFEGQIEIYEPGRFNGR